VPTFSSTHQRTGLALIDDLGTETGQVAECERPNAARAARPRAITERHLTRQDAANLADAYVWSPLSAAEMPYYQKEGATHRRLTRWVRIRNPRLSGVGEYITMHWDDDGKWTDLANTERYQRGVSIGTDWTRTIRSMAEQFYGGMSDEDHGCDAAKLPRLTSGVEPVRTATRQPSGVFMA
jgi:hypothetical protein